MLRCAISDGVASGFVNTTQIERLGQQVRRWSIDEIDLIQLREKDLEPRDLFALAGAAMQTLRELHSATKLLINGRADVAIAAGAHGVHVTSHAAELMPEQVRALYAHARLAPPIITASCHTADEIARARNQHVDTILFGPVFEKRASDKLISSGVGLDALAEACRRAHPIPVLALGGITRQNASACIAAGAAGIAGIRSFA